MLLLLMSQLQILAGIVQTANRADEAFAYGFVNLLMALGFLSRPETLGACLQAAFVRLFAVVVLAVAPRGMLVIRQRAWSSTQQRT